MEYGTMFGDLDWRRAVCQR